MRILKHITGQPFVFATGLAALVHSTWTLGTFFGGVQPDAPLALAGWLLPAFLIAFALDVGQIVTSAEIREHGLGWGRALTFFVFAGATYYCQWIYLAHHMPALQIAAGVSETAKGAVVAMRDAAVWIMPALLPLSTILYTFSGKSGAKSEPIQAPNPPQVELLQVQQTDLALPEPDNGKVEQVGKVWVATFKDWRKEYSNEYSARKGLLGYLRQYRRPVVMASSENGHSPVVVEEADQ
jgi:hypothetical protein